MNMRATPWTGCVLVTLWAWSRQALAVSDTFTVPTAESPTPWGAIVYLLVALAGICVVAFKHSKRTHLD